MCLQLQGGVLVYRALKVNAADQLAMVTPYISLSSKSLLESFLFSSSPSLSKVSLLEITSSSLLMRLDAAFFSSFPRNFRERSNLFVLESPIRMLKISLESFSFRQLLRIRRNSPNSPILISPLKIVLSSLPPSFNKSWYFSSSVLQ